MIYQRQLQYNAMINMNAEKWETRGGFPLYKCYDDWSCRELLEMPVVLTPAKERSNVSGRPSVLSYNSDLELPSLHYTIGNPIRHNCVTNMASSASVNEANVANKNEMPFSLQQYTDRNHVEGREKRKAVRFTEPFKSQDCGDDDDGSARTSRLVLTDENCKKLWYQKDELAAIRNEARQIIERNNDSIGNKARRIFQQNLQQNDSINAKEHKPDFAHTDHNEKENNDPTDDGAFGLERFMNNNRSRTTLKRSAIHYILQGQRHCRENKKRSRISTANCSMQREAEFIRNVSLKCSKWAIEAALEQGFRDYQDAVRNHCDSALSTSSTVSSSSCEERCQINIDTESNNGNEENGRCCDHSTNVKKRKRIMVD